MDYSQEELEACKALESAESIHLEISALGLYMLIALVRLAMRHPQFAAERGPTYQAAAEFIELAESRLVGLHPKIAESLKQGADQSLDMTPEDFEQFRKTGDLPQRNYSQLREDIQREVILNSLALSAAVQILAQLTRKTEQKWIERIYLIAKEWLSERSQESIKAELARIDFQRDFERYQPPSDEP